MYHPDKCPNDNTPGMNKQQCENEFKILNSEYINIKEKLGVSGGKKRKHSKVRRTRKTKKHTKRYSSKMR
jgi:hypothetical protein